MHSILIPFYIVVYLVSSTLSQKLFLLGGHVDDANPVWKDLYKLTKKEQPVIAVAISGASSLEVGLEAYNLPDETHQSYKDLFLSYGFQPKLIELAIDNYETAAKNPNNIDIVSSADVIFFNGGDQSRHARAWLNDDGSDSPIMKALRKRVNDGAIIAGTSAGTAVQDNPTFGEGVSYGYLYYNADLAQKNIGDLNGLADDREGTSDFRYYNNGGYMHGFNFLPTYLMDTHFDTRGRFGRLIVALKNLKKSVGLGVGEDTALFIDKDQATVFGKAGVTIIDVEDAIFPSTYYFSAENVRITYLTHGDSYDFTEKSIKTSKYFFKGSQTRVYESDDIFGNFELIKTISSLVTSSSSESIGLSKESNPTFRVSFIKDDQYHGFGIETDFSVQNLRVDISDK